MNFQQIIDKLQLNKHPEGGYFKETYRSEEYVKKEDLPDRYRGKRNFYTSIYFMLTKNDISKFHRIKSDEIWHFYQGDPLDIFVIRENGVLDVRKLGNYLLNGESPQILIEKNHWFAAKISGSNYSLLGCSVSPGFEFEDFELAERGELIQQYPHLKETITRLT